MAGLGVSMGQRLSFPRDACGVAGLGRLPHANKAVKIKIRMLRDCSWQKKTGARGQSLLGKYFMGSPDWQNAAHLPCW